jgi:CBS domain-containing protein
MTPNPISIRADVTIPEAVAFLVDTGYSAAPVIDEAGRPIGVISRTDMVVYDREKLDGSEVGGNWFESPDLTSCEARPGDVIQVRDLMTPTILGMAPETPVEQVAQRMVEQNVHRLFVVDRDGVLVGVISALDLLSHLTASR